MSETGSELLLFQTEDGHTRIQVRLEENSVWLTQRLMADLFQVSVGTINYHVKEVFKDRELAPGATIRKHRIVREEGGRQVSRLVDFYNLEMILAVGYRVRSHRGVQFRQWATERLSEYLVKGFSLDDAKLKEGRTLGKDYFDELLDRIRDIRASEKRFYQKIRDLYKLSIDYDPKGDQTRRFFQIVQNKLHWATSRRTAAEIIATRADAAKPNMGLTSWKGVKVRQDDVGVAKNYLNEEEIRQLNRIVTMYLDYAEMQAERRVPLYMKDWAEQLDGFLKFTGQEILHGAGKMSMEVAKKLALDEYRKFHANRLALEAREEDDAVEGMAELEQEAKRLEGKDGGEK